MNNILSGNTSQESFPLPSLTKSDPCHPPLHDRDIVEATATPDMTMFNTYLQALFAWAMDQPGEDRTVTEAAQMQAINEMAAKDPLEVAMIYQMIACNHQVFNLLAKAQKATFADSAKDLLILANRFMATYAKQVEAMARYQRKGTQTVLVKHVHAPGSQILVGNVEIGRGEGR